MASDSQYRPSQAARGSTFLPFLIIVSIVGIAAYIFFKPPGVPGGGAAVPKPPRPVPLAGWEAPALAFVLSGEMHGYIEPCGCTEGQVGGLMRRATLVKTMQEQKKWPVIGLDNGGTMHPKRVTRRQTRMKFDFTRDALEQIGFVSINVGPEEAYLRDDGLMAVREVDKQKVDFALRLQSANVSVYPGVEELADVVPKFQLLDKGGLKTVVVTVVDPAMAPGILPQEGAFEVGDPAESLTAILPEIEALAPDLLVLLAFASLDRTKELVTQFPQFHLATAAGARKTRSSTPSWSVKR